jgi:hypothetical protein
MKAPASSPQLEAVMGNVLKNLKAVNYGDVSVALKVHDGRVVSVTYSVTQTVREIKEEKNMTP